MTLEAWGLSPERLAMLSPAQIVDYEGAISEYDATIRECDVPWARMAELPFPPPAPEGIRTLARAIREIDEELRSPP